MIQQPDVRPSLIAGTWYNRDPGLLAREIDAYLDEAVPYKPEGQVIGLVAPHAGIRFSGRTAGRAFAAVRGQSREVVAVLSPYHHPHMAPLLTSAHTAYWTPLGEVPVDLDLLNRLDETLRAGGMPGLVRLPRDEEHSLEIELPFLQRALEPGFRLLPVMVRTRASAPMRALGLALADVLPEGSLLVASTDLSHYYPQPVAERLDREMLRRIEQFAPLNVLAAEEAGAGFACGVGAVAAVLWAAREMGANAVQTVHYSTSGDQSGDFGAVVGYGACVIYQRAAVA